jgi:hypothetical protein
MMRKVSAKVGAVVLVASLVAAMMILASPAHAKNKVFCRQAANGVDINVFTVPMGKKFVVGSVIIGNLTSQDACCAQIYRVIFGGTASIIMQVGIPAYGHFNHNMQNMVFEQGQTIRVRNGSNAAVTELYVTITGDLVNR